MFRIICYIAACCLATSLLAFSALAEENCTVCHKGIRPEGRHAGLTCQSCHLRESTAIVNPSSGSSHAVRCVACHRGQERVCDHVMATRSRENRFVERSYARVDSGYRAKNCDSCHVRSCLDCHAAEHAIRVPPAATCQGCHKGYYTVRTLLHLSDPFSAAA